MHDYIEFVLELRDLDTQSDTFKVAVLPSPATGEIPAIAVHFNDKALTDALRDLEMNLIDEQDLIRLGEQLADWLLPQGSVRSLFEETVRRAGRDKGIRLRLVIYEPRLAQIPWEFTYLQRHPGEKNRSHFLTLNPQISLVRHEALPEPHPSLVGATSRQLRLVVAMANPVDSLPLQLNKEKRVIEKALSACHLDDVAFNWQPIIDDTTSEDLQKIFQQKVDIFHFAGHAIFQKEKGNSSGEKGKGGILLLKDKQSKRSELLDAQLLGLYLQNAGVRLAIFGACESGRRDGISAWTGIVSAIVEQGLPAVVAMQYRIRDASAIAFSQALYTALQSGLSVDKAVSLGRLAMLGEAGTDDVSWGIPVLYMRSINGVLFPGLNSQRSNIAEQYERVIEQTVDLINQGGIVLGVNIERGKVCSRSDSSRINIRQKAHTVSGTMIGYQEK